jgi:hypothetical protein
MKVVIHKGQGKTVEFQIDIEFEYLLNYCIFCYHHGYVSFGITTKNRHIFPELMNKQKYQLHQIIYYLKTGIMSNTQNHVDHIDQDKTNNLMKNLRLISHSENLKNKPLRNGQIYYNITFSKYSNDFLFMHHEVDHGRRFTKLEDALAYFTEYDNKNNNILTKHITNLKPISDVVIFERDPPIKCDHCDSYLSSRCGMNKHLKNKHSSN